VIAAGLPAGEWLMSTGLFIECDIARKPRVDVKVDKKIR
jgi:hypothetical protein